MGKTRNQATLPDFGERSNRRNGQAKNDDTFTARDRPGHYYQQPLTFCYYDDYSFWIE